ncbi:MAG: recombinase family protein, partial [Planctomycetota bacterium]
MRKKASELGLSFRADDASVKRMADEKRAVEGDVYLDYGVSGNLMSRPGFDALQERITNDTSVSHLFVPRRDRLARPDNPLEAVAVEFQIRSLGVTLVTLEKTLPPFQIGERIDLMEILSAILDYDVSGRFRLQLAEKLILAKLVLAKGGFSIGGEPPYGFHRWLVDLNGAKKRQLEVGEHTKMAGHHVMWLPTAEEELKIVFRIIEEIRTIPACRIAKKLNEEGIPSPKADRFRTIDKANNIRFKNSGFWTQTTVRAIATNPLLIALCVYCHRSEGDQLRMTSQGTRKLTDSDYRDRKLISVRNPEDQQIRTPAKFEPLIAIETRDEICKILEHRGRHLKGKSRTRAGTTNPLGARIFDMNCGWAMFRNMKDGRWCYSCGLYMNSHAQCCSHNLVRGEKATRFVLESIKQRVLNDVTFDKLADRLRQMAQEQAGVDPLIAKKKSLENELRYAREKRECVGRNMSLSEDAEILEVMKKTFKECSEKVRQLEGQLLTFPAERPVCDPEQEVGSALATLSRLGTFADEATPEATGVAELFHDLDAKLYLKFGTVIKGRQHRYVPTG